jgi:hypothetical protein
MAENKKTEEAGVNTPNFNEAFEIFKKLINKLKDDKDVNNFKKEYIKIRKILKDGSVDNNEAKEKIKLIDKKLNINESLKSFKAFLINEGIKDIGGKVRGIDKNEAINLIRKEKEQKNSNPDIAAPSADELNNGAEELEKEKENNKTEAKPNEIIDLASDFIRELEEISKIDPNETLKQLKTIEIVQKASKKITDESYNNLNKIINRGKLAWSIDNIFDDLKKEQFTINDLATLILINNYFDNISDNNHFFKANGEFRELNSKDDINNFTRKNGEYDETVSELYNKIYEKKPTENGQLFAIVIKDKEKVEKIIKLAYRINPFIKDEYFNKFKNCNYQQIVNKLNEDLEKYKNGKNIEQEQEQNKERSNTNSFSGNLEDRINDKRNEFREMSKTMEYGYSTPIVYNFPRDKKEENKTNIRNYFNGLKNEVEKHFERLAKDNISVINKRAKILHPENYWEECLKNASVYNKTLNEGAAKLLGTAAKRYFGGLKDNALNKISNAWEDKKDHSSYKKDYKNYSKKEDEHKKRSGNDYDYDYENETTKGETRTNNSLDDFKTSCMSIIDNQTKECEKLYDRATSRVSVAVYDKNISKIISIMRETKKLLKEKEMKFNDIIKKGGLKKRIQDFVIDKTYEKDANKRAYDIEQRELERKEIEEWLNISEKDTKTQLIAKWLLAAILIENQNLTPKGILSILNSNFSTLKILNGGTFKDNKVYNIDDVKPVYDQTSFGYITHLSYKSAASYNTPMELFMATLPAFKRASSQPLNIIKDFKNCLTNNNEAYLDRAKTFKSNMDTYFKKRKELQKILMQNSLASSNIHENIIDPQDAEKYGLIKVPELAASLFGPGKDHINFDERGPEDLAAIEQFINSNMVMIKNADGIYFTTEYKLKELKTNSQKMLKNFKQQFTKQKQQFAKNVGQAETPEFQDIQADNGYSMDASVKTNSTVTTGAVGDTVVPQRLPTSQDVMKRKLNFTTYTYKNGPITIQKRKYDD